MPKIFIALFFFIMPMQLRSQVLPKEGSQLNYRIIGFSFPPVPKTVRYTVEIAGGYYLSTDSFLRKSIRSVNGTGAKIIAEVPSFGSQYTWCIVYTGKKGKTESALYHFSTEMSPRVDTGKLRLRILQPAAGQYKDDYVSVDGGGVLYDMSGRPVWYVPEINGISGYVADMKFTSQGTVTFIYKDAYEMNYNGEILWKSPAKATISKDSVHGEYYHHEFTRLSNGHYMILGTEILMCKFVSSKDSNYVIVSDSRNVQNGYTPGRFGTIIEYDEKGNIVWSWRSSKYFIGSSDFGYYEAKIDSNKRFDPHDNSFFFDEKNKVIYLGFRNLSRVMKIGYPGGEVTSIYGEIFKPGAPPQAGAGLFCNQHNVSITQEGYICYFNNNSCQLTDSLPTVVILEEPVLPTDTLKKVWEYTCTMEGNFRKNFGNGGNVKELPGRALFVNMGSDYSKLFIVNPEKKVLWSALPERFIETDRIWKPNREYRANIISRKELERFIWGAEDIKSPQ